MKKEFRIQNSEFRIKMSALLYSAFFILNSSFFVSCKKEAQFVYETNPVDVKQDGADKANVKSTLEFVSIAYTDVFGKEIPNAKLVNLTTAYLAFGDKKLVEDMIVRNFLNDSTATIPTMQQMRSNVPQFVSTTYNKLLNRNPNEFEKFYISNIIEKDATVSPVMLYYAIMTCNEYRYY